MHLSSNLVRGTLSDSGRIDAVVVLVVTGGLNLISSGKITRLVLEKIKRKALDAWFPPI